MAAPTPKLPPEWLLRLQQLQQMQEQQQAEQSAGIDRAAALQAGPQEQFDARFAGLDAALASAQNPQPSLPLAPYGERFLGGMPAYRPPIPETLPRVNAAGRWAKNQPWLEPMIGGVADAAATIGTPEYRFQDGVAAAYEGIPFAKGASQVLGRVAGPVGRNIERWYDRRPAHGKGVTELAANAGISNPFGRPVSDPVFDDR